MNRLIFHAFVTTVTGSILLSLSGVNSAQAVSITFFPSTVFSSDPTILNQNVGITGYTIEDFEDKTLIPGLSITYSGGVSTSTITSLPDLSNQVSQSWDGQHTLFNIPSNQLSNSVFCPSTECAKLTTLNFSNSIISVGIGLSGFQSLNPPPSAPDNPITDHRLLINGIPFSQTIEQLAGVNWKSANFQRNAYLRIDALQGESISSIGFENITAVPSTEDVLEFDHLAIKSVAQPPQSVPEPSNVFGLGLLGLGLAATKVKSVLSKKTKSPTDKLQEPDS
ncbi:MAG: PEP-CTERM sorting domain-containing protein [Microcystis aeruginosa G11-01]|nr:PEP-CTERM sorting domain-containing protein [Microcystis aeruginosa G13-10]NCS34538.1 PEP-CTERM sorting domain-containing protein [Microcystis aeruginosa G11-01]